MVESYSPYIKLLADRGINWHYTITKDLVRIANEEDKLFFIHIGYISNIFLRESAIELFSDQAIIEIINKNFIPILVDREEKPEAFLLGIDLLMLNKDFSYGPMNIFALPNRRPLVCFSNCDFEYFLEIGNNLIKANRDKKSLLIKLSDELSSALSFTGVVKEKVENITINQSILDKYFEYWTNSDITDIPTNKTNPFSPNPVVYFYLLEYIKVHPNESVANSIKMYLDHLQHTAIFDSISGGIFRQAVDFSCSEPLYEKTLVENAHFLALYASAYKYFGDNEYKKSAYMIYYFIKNELFQKDVGLFSSTTLMNSLEDSVYYTFSINELSILFPNNYREISEALNFNLNFNRFEQQIPIRLPNIEYSINDSVLNLLRERRQEHRGYYKDKRVITAYNCDAISSIAFASSMLDDDFMLQFASDNLEYIFYNKIDKDGDLCRSTNDDKPIISGYLSDYALFVEAINSVYRISNNPDLLIISQKFTNKIIEKFYKVDNGMFNKSFIDEGIIPFKREPNIDLLRPSANAVMAGNLISMYEFTKQEQYLIIAKQQIMNIIPNFDDSNSLLLSWAYQMMRLLRIT